MRQTVHNAVIRNYFGKRGFHARVILYATPIGQRAKILIRRHGFTNLINCTVETAENHLDRMRRSYAIELATQTQRSF